MYIFSTLLHLLLYYYITTGNIRMLTTCDDVINSGNTVHHGNIDKTFYSVFFLKFYIML